MLWKQSYRKHYVAQNVRSPKECVRGNKVRPTRAHIHTVALWNHSYIYALYTEFLIHSHFHNRLIPTNVQTTNCWKQPGNPSRRLLSFGLIVGGNNNVLCFKFFAPFYHRQHCWYTQYTQQHTLLNPHDSLFWNLSRFSHLPHFPHHVPEGPVCIFKMKRLIKAFYWLD